MGSEPCRRLKKLSSVSTVARTLFLRLGLIPSALVRHDNCGVSFPTCEAALECFLIPASCEKSSYPTTVLIGSSIASSSRTSHTAGQNCSSARRLKGKNYAQGLILDGGSITHGIIAHIERGEQDCACNSNNNKRCNLKSQCVFHYFTCTFRFLAFPVACISRSTDNSPASVHTGWLQTERSHTH